MPCTLGRITGLQSPKTIRQTGGRLRIGGEFAVTDVEGRRLAAQLAGYPNPDEEVISFTYDATIAGGRLDGFYVPLSVDVDWVKLASGLFSWDADLVAVSGLQSPMFEVTSAGPVRLNGHAIVGAEPWVGLSPGAACSNVTGGGVAVTRATRSSEAGNVIFFSGGSDAFADDSMPFFLDPPEAYLGAARIRLTEDGTTYNTVVGRQIYNRPTGWMIDNGLLQVSPHPTAGGLLVSAWTGAAWESRTAEPVASTDLTAAPTPLPFYPTGPYAVTVLRNSPEAVTIQVDAEFTAFPGYDLALQLHLRRGSRYVEGRIIRRWSGSVNYLGIRTRNQAGTAEAATDLTGGRRQTSNDTDGNRYVWLIPGAYSTHGTLTGVYHANVAINDFRFAYGLEVGGSGSAYPDRAADMKDQYFSATHQRQQIAIR